jgi:hypothetical protein
MTRGGLYRRQAFTARATAAGERGATAPSGLAGEESVLTFTADFRRLILAFHKFFKFSPGQKPEFGRIVIKTGESRHRSALAQFLRCRGGLARRGNLFISVAGQAIGALDAASKVDVRPNPRRKKLHDNERNRFILHPSSLMVHPPPDPRRFP